MPVLSAEDIIPRFLLFIAISGRIKSDKPVFYLGNL